MTTAEDAMALYSAFENTNYANPYFNLIAHAEQLSSPWPGVAG